MRVQCVVVLGLRSLPLVDGFKGPAPCLSVLTAFVEQLFPIHPVPIPDPMIISYDFPYSMPELTIYYMRSF